MDQNHPLFVHIMNILAILVHSIYRATSATLEQWTLVVKTKMPNHCGATWGCGAHSELITLSIFSSLVSLSLSLSGSQ